MTQTRVLAIAYGTPISITQFMQEAPERTLGATAAPGLVVADERGDVFVKLRSLDLGTAIWRVLRDPNELGLPEDAVVVCAAYEDPAWATVEKWAQRYVTVVATMEPREDERLRALHAGAFGYVDLSMPHEGLRRTFLGVLRGEPAFSRDVMGAWLRRGRLTGRDAVSSGRADRLTARQREIVGLIAAGATDKEIGAALGIRTATAQKHVANLLHRLGVSNRAAAVGALLKEGEALTETARSDRRRR